MKMKPLIISCATAISLALTATSASAQINPNDSKVKNLRNYDLKPIRSLPLLPNAKPNYSDLINYSNSDGKCNGNYRNYFVTHVTGINQATPQGTHFFTSFGQTGLVLDDNNNFNSRYVYDVSFSDRAGARGQSFDINRRDKSSIILHTATNSITITSQTWNSTKTYYNLIRRGNRIIGSDKDSTIVLNLKKAVDPCFQ